MLNLSKVYPVVVFVVVLYVSILEMSVALSNVTENHSISDFANSKLLNIDEAFRIAVKDGLTVEILTSRLEQARQKMLQAKLLYWPVVNLKASYSSKDDYEIGNEKINMYELGMNVSWFLFDGFKRKFENIIADYDKKVAEVSFEESIRSLYLSISFAFYQAQLFREKISIAISDEKFCEHQLSEAEAKYEVGLGSLDDILSLRIRLNKVKMVRSLEEKNYKVAMLSLASLLGNADPDFVSTTKLRSFLPETNMELIPPDEGKMVKVALESRPDITKRRLHLQQSRVLVGLSKSSAYPKIYISASANMRKTGEIEFSRDDISGSVSLGMSYELFPGGIQTTKTREAKEREFELKKEMKQFVISTKNEIKGAFLKLCNAQLQVSSQRQNTKLLEQRRDLMLKKYESNHVDMIALNEIQNEFIKARRQLVISIIALRQTWTEYKMLTGNLIHPLIKHNKTSCNTHNGKN